MGTRSPDRAPQRGLQKSPPCLCNEFLRRCRRFFADLCARTQVQTSKATRVERRRAPVSDPTDLESSNHAGAPLTRFLLPLRPTLPSPPSEPPSPSAPRRSRESQSAERGPSGWWKNGEPTKGADANIWKSLWGRGGLETLAPSSSPPEPSSGSLEAPLSPPPPGRLSGGENVLVVWLLKILVCVAKGSQALTHRPPQMLPGVLGPEDQFFWHTSSYL